MDAPLPGFEPDYIRLDFINSPTEGWSLLVFHGDAPGFYTPADADHYTNLTAFEACDVAGAALDGLLGLWKQEGGS